MRRRDFLAGSAGLAGALIPGLSAGQGSPCPPPTVGVTGGSAVSAKCGPGESAGAPAWFEQIEELRWYKVAVGPPAGQYIDPATGTQSDIYVDPDHALKRIAEWQKGDTIFLGSYLRRYGYPYLASNGGVWTCPLHGSEKTGPNRLPGTFPAPNITSYGGGTVHQATKTLWAFGGGHNSYNGNEWYKLDLRAEQPFWTYDAPASPGAHCTASSNMAFTNNGTGQFEVDRYLGREDPQSPHSYGWPTMTNGGRIYTLSEGSNGATTGSSMSYYYDTNAKSWKKLSRWIEGYMGAQTDGSYGIYVPERDEVWMSGNAATWSDDVAMVRVSNADGTPVLNKIAKKAIPDGGGAHWQSAFGCAVPGRMFFDGKTRIVKNYSFPGDGVYDKLQVFDPSNPGYWDDGTGYKPDPYKGKLVSVINNTGHALGNNPIGAEVYAPLSAWNPCHQLPGGNFVWHDASNAILASAGTTEWFYKFTPPVSGNPYDPWTLSKVNPANLVDANRVIPPRFDVKGFTSSGAGNYNRWNIIADMGNGQSCIVYLPTHGMVGATFVMKLPAKGV